MVRNFTSLQTYQLKDMIERAPVYQKSIYQKQIISKMSFKVGIPKERPTTGFTTLSLQQTAHGSTPQGSIRDQRPASSKIHITATQLPINTAIIASSKTLTPTPSTSNNTSLNDSKVSRHQTKPVMQRPRHEKVNTPPLPPQPTTKTATSVLPSSNVTAKHLINLEKINSQRLIKLSDRTKPVLKPVRKNSISKTNKDLLLQPLPPPSQSPNVSLSPLSSPSPSGSPRVSLKTTVTLLKSKVDSVLTFKNIVTKNEVRSRPSSRNANDGRRESRGAPISILKNSIIGESSTIKGKRRFSRSSFSSALNEMNSTTGTINENVLNDICEQPKSHHLTSSLSTDAQYATLKVYEDLMHQRITTLFPHLDYLPRVSSARFSKSSVTTNSTSVSSKMSSISGSVNSSKMSVRPLGSESIDEYRKLRVTHFIESAMKLIDAMDKFQKRKLLLKTSSLEATESSKKETSTTITYPVLGRVVNLSNTSSALEEEDIIETYLKWIDLWNKYLDEQALN